MTRTTSDEISSRGHVVPVIQAHACDPFHGAVEDCCNPEGYTVNMRPAELRSKTLSRTRGEEKEVKESGERGEER